MKNIYKIKIYTKVMIPRYISIAFVIFNYLKKNIVVSGDDF
jgi:hypothetical protein